MLNYEFTANDTEKTFVYEDKDGLRTNLSKLVETPNDPQCLSIAKYKENGEIITEMTFYEEEKELLRKWIDL